MDTLEIRSLISISIGILVLFIGKRVNGNIQALKNLSIPDSVTGGLIAALAITLVKWTADIEVIFDLGARDFLLIYFFTTVGISSNLINMRRGGKTLGILLGLVIAFITIQNIFGELTVNLFGLQKGLGPLLGSVSLAGGHGVTIAWAPIFAKQFSIKNALEIGIAASTFGLIVASLIGGPIANHLIRKNQLNLDHKKETYGANRNGEENTNKLALNNQLPSELDYNSILSSVLAVNVCIILGKICQGFLFKLDIQLPLFVVSMIVGIILSSILPDRKISNDFLIWPKQTAALLLLAELSLGTFLAMSIMSLQFWDLLDLPPALLLILLSQAILSIAVNLYLVFPLMGRNYEAAVICAGFAGMSIGSSTAGLANMTAISRRYGPTNKAFIVVPLIATFIEIINSGFIIPASIRFL